MSMSLLVQDLGEIETDKSIIVKNISTEATEGTVENFIEVISKEEIEHTYYNGNIKSVLLVQFTCPVTDIAGIQERASKRFLCGQLVEVEKLGAVNGLVVSGFGRDVSESSDILELYFEREKIGGQEGCVTNVKVHKSLYLAVLDIATPATVVPRILRHKHKLEGNEVKVQPYYPKFHDPVIKQLLEFGFLIDDKNNEKDDGYEDLGGISKEKLKSTRQMEDTSKHREEHIYDEILDDEDDDDVYSTIGESTSSVIKPSPQAKDIPKHDEKIMTLYERIPQNWADAVPSRGSRGGNLKILVSDSPSTGDMRHEADKQTFGGHFSPETGDMRPKVDKLAFGGHSSPETGDMRSKADKQTYGGHSSPENKSDSPCNRRPKFSLFPDDDDIVDDDEDDNEVIDREKGFSSSPVGYKKDSPQRSSSCTMDDQNVTRKMDLSKAKVLLLRISKFDKQHPRCQIILNTSNDFVKIMGNQADVSEAFEDLWSKLNHVKECYQSLSAEKHLLLKQMKKSQPDCFKRVLQEKKIRSFISLSADEDTSVTASAFSKDEAQRALKEITSLIEEKEIYYTEESFHYLSSDEWSQLLSRLERQVKVKIKVIRSQKIIHIVGSKEYVESACDEIKKTLDKNSNVTAKPIVITGGKAKLFRFCLQDDISRLRDSVRSKGGNLDYKSDQDSYTVTIKGNQETVRRTERTIHQMLKDIWEGIIDLSRLGIKDKMMIAASKGLMSRKGRELIVGFSKDNSCVIVVERGQNIQVRSSRRESAGYIPFERAASVPELYYNRRPRHVRNYSPSSEDEDDVIVPSRPPQNCTVRVNNTSITVKHGNITDEKASVLVNVMGRSRKTDESIISKNFFKAGGPILQQNFQANNDSSSNVVITPGGKSLQCQNVCHMIIHRFDNSNKVKHHTRLAFQEVYNKASMHGATSISFPAVGPGRLLQYPAKYAAECMVSEAVNACQTYNFQHITFVIFDIKMMDTFVRRLQQENPGGAFLTPVASVPTFQQTHPKTRYRRRRRNSSERYHRHKYDKQSEHTSSGSSDDDSQASRETTHAMAKISMLATTRDHGERIKHKFQKKMTEWFCMKEKILDSHIKVLDRGSKKDIYELASGKLVEVDINTDKGKITLLGSKESIDQVSKEIYKILLQAKDVPKSHKALRHKRGTLGFWQEMSKEPPVPQYWKAFKDKGIISGLLDVFRKAVSWKGANLHDVDPKTFTAVKTLTESTFDGTMVGKGQDATGLIHRAIKVKKVQRIENFELYQTYGNKRANYFRSLADNNSIPADLSKLKQASKGGIISAQNVDRLLLSDMYHEINEHYFFHGTDQTSVDNIADKGLDPRHSNDQGMFGPGIYGAESSTKADQYTDVNKNARNPNDRKMLLIRLILGNIFVSSTPQKFKIPPCMQCQTPSCKIAGHRPYDSVVGDGKWIFREFVVYAKEQCYPEYVITYDRL